MDMFLVKYLVCSVGLPSAVASDARVKSIRVEATASPDNSSFWMGIPARERVDYHQFAEEMIRIEVQTTQPEIFYLAFRTARDPRPDLGPRKYTLARPSSVELGYCHNSQQGYTRLCKKHYTDYGQQLDARALAKAITNDLAETICNNLK